MPSILIVYHDFPPAWHVGGKRVLRMATHLSSLGWKIDVLCARHAYFEKLDMGLVPSDARFRVTRTHAFAPKLWGRRLRDRLRSMTREASQGTGHEGRAHPLFHLWDMFVSVPDERAGWIPFALIAALRLRRPDVVLASGPPFSNAIAGLLISRLRRTRLVLDYRDPWTTLAERHAWLPRWRWRLDRGLEERCLRRADLVVATTRSLADALAPLRPRETVVVPNAYDPDLFDRVPATTYDRFTVVYTGGFYGSRSVLPVLEALQLLRGAGRLADGAFELRVVGPDSAKVRELAHSLGVAQFVETEAFLPYHQALSRMKGADVLLLVVGEMHGGLIPAKFFEYLAARRFVLGVGPGGSEAARLVGDLGVGVSVEQRDVSGIARVLEDRLRMPRGGVPLPAAAERYAARATMAELDRSLRRLLA